MDRTPEPAGPRQWTPGGGWERVKRAFPHLVPELTDEDERHLDELLAAASQEPGGDQRAV